MLTGAGEVVTRDARRRARRPVPHLPQLLRLARLRARLRIELEPVHPYVAPAARALRRRSARSPTRSATIVRDPRRTTASRSTSSTASSSAADEAYLTLGRWTDHLEGRRDRATTPAQQIYYRSIQQRARRRADRARLPVALGHRLVLVLAARSAPSTRACAGSGRGAGCAATSTTSSSASRTATTSGAGSTGRAGQPERERVVQDVEIPLEPHGRVPRAGSDARSPIGRSGCARCGCATDAPAVAGRRPPWPLYPLRPDETYVNVGFWWTVAIEPGAPDGDVNRAIEAKVDRARRPQVALLRRLLRPRDLRPALRRRQPSARSSSGTTPTTGCPSLYDKAVRRR